MLTYAKIANGHYEARKDGETIATITRQDDGWNRGWLTSGAAMEWPFTFGSLKQAKRAVANRVKA